ncbi:hypothetical protein IW261DRAFT_1336724 [Armillaria novae-zelandiae]|uniref:Uncharacterized protein n=1 Tax=Armillaria novae-zelandiae TaxID=153914 RepID=A0AA39P7P4_9AGAR|nr:hypothetical protein IW261DRAFT_1336724 [Armillaria novae-zelandiae]
MFHSDETKEVLLLSSSASTIQVLRHQWGCRPGQSIYDIIHELLDRGIAFNFAIPGPYRSLKAEPDPIHARIAGYRPKNYKPDHLDFVAYEWHRNAFLRSPRGQAACLMGGIVGRLAHGVVPYEDVYHGPSEDVFEDGVNFQDSEQPSVTLWDDRLTSDELDLVCSVYRIDTGQRGQYSNQMNIISWWPKPLAWETSGLYIGFWSSDCEAWFQRWLDDIHSGKADLRTLAQWKHSIKFLKQCNKVAQVNEKLTAEYLQKI